MIKYKRLGILLAGLLLVFNSFGHSGRTDRYGGHHDRKNGGYHNHNSGNSDNDSSTGLIILLVIGGLIIIGMIAKGKED